jgi:hypothetical protein
MSIRFAALMGIAALSCFAVDPAFAQKKGEFRQPKPLTQPDRAILQEAVNTVKQGAECDVTYVITTEGKPKDIKPNCTVADYDPYVVRAMESMTYQSEIYDGELFDSDPLKFPMKFGAAAQTTPPSIKTALDQKDVARAANRAKKAGECNPVYTVGVDGKPKDIVPNCTLPELNDAIKAAVAKMEYTPATRDGKPVDFPNVEQSFKFGG